MSAVLQAIDEHAMHRGDALALEGSGMRLSYAELQQAIHAVAAEFTLRGIRTAALAADNGLAWALADLAAISAGIRLVPLPLFFSPAQMAHALQQSGADTLLFAPRLPPAAGLFDAPSQAIGSWPASLPPLHLRQDTSLRSECQLPAGTRKITFTSGTTGAPKGVCLGQQAQETVAQELRIASGACHDFRHLCAMPLSTLLENVGGLYAPLLAGAAACMPALDEVGLSGAAQFNVMRLLSALRQTRANSLILVPQLLLALVMALEARRVPLPQLRFIAVGGASVSPSLLARAAALGLPVFEGYGLSECASVVALNRPGARRAGSVGRPLPHLRLSFAADGEILVAGNRFLGYTGEDPLTEQSVATGDIGHLDADGYLYITGRRKNLFITAFGRNVAPEWVERELCVQPAIAQAAVFGEARPWNAAVIVARTDDIQAIQAAVNAANETLPDYARVHRWIVASAAFAPGNNQATANGRIRREIVRAHYARQLECLYRSEELSDA